MFITWDIITTVDNQESFNENKWDTFIFLKEYFELHYWRDSFKKFDNINIVLALMGQGIRR